MRVAVLDHGMGNLRSVAKALEAAGASVVVTAEPREIEGADALCVPGQGIFGRCMENITQIGAADLVAGWARSDRPFLGICLGMQVLFGYSEEGGGGDGLGVFGGKVTRLPNRVPVPHIGWNTVNDTYFYFDHSYAVHPEDAAMVAGWCEHGERFAAWVEDGSLLAVQFHPEKSGKSGIELLRKWVENG
ncbi:MAG: imidazole glycerol phosphate synthase subunit HisH [Actinomycetota bacterium]